LVFARECFEANENPNAFDSANGNGRLTPSPGVRADGGDLPKQCIGATLDRRDFFLGNMRRISAKPAWFAFAVKGNLFPLIVEHAD
jgi:hypothetical protein